MFHYLNLIHFLWIDTLNKFDIFFYAIRLNYAKDGTLGLCTIILMKSFGEHLLFKWLTQLNIVIVVRARYTNLLQRNDRLHLFLDSLGILLNYLGKPGFFGFDEGKWVFIGLVNNYTPY